MKYIRAFILILIVLILILVLPSPKHPNSKLFMAYGRELTADYSRWLPTVDSYNSERLHHARFFKIRNDFLPNSEEAIISVINTHRMENGLNAVKFNQKLQQAARIRSKEMFDNDYFQHQRPDGKRWYNVLNKDVPFEYLSAGENIAVMYTEVKYITSPFPAEEWYKCWEQSPTHYETMMDPTFTYVGAGVYSGIIDGQYYSYATTIFVRI